ncbi:5-oxoprolinase subunit PxpB [Oleiagrimonas soli]|uniref:Inhibitor of KinA n=1 Tax=Oleiagrimonas soli TaxID=1543381 RepID=A0A099CX05_9GAMM|nr:5-oxoprolinase subunit PxpB [Oleiagrimonas soli]KGI78289.1 hypothetical protein LF63_0108210 [Oleiagrimonas soli]MBB6183225.1 inhibitor of KinA [Oleiagrimonas soli]
MHVAFETLDEHSILLRLADTIDPEVNARVHALATALRAADLPRLRDLVPAYASLLLRFDAPTPGRADDDLRARIETVVNDPEAWPVAFEQGAWHRIPVCYDITHGEDVAAVAEALDLSVEDVVRRHSAAEYRVAMLGFAPGFAYLLGMDPSLAMPRRATPRTRVPAGSIAIGGAQTGIYPRELPGGWQLIGRTPLSMFDPFDDARPCRLAPGDRVQFEPIDPDAFERLQRESGA